MIKKIKNIGEVEFDSSNLYFYLLSLIIYNLYLFVIIIRKMQINNFKIEILTNFKLQQN